MTKQPWQEELNKAREHIAKAINLAQNQVTEDGYDLTNLSVYISLHSVQELCKRNPTYVIECIDLDMTVS